MTEARATLAELPASPASLPRARELAAQTAGKLMAEDQLQKLALVVTELVSNAVRHSQATGAVRLAMTPKPEFLCVQVTDEGHGLVPAPGAIGSEAGAGYGLFLVEQLTRRWGMTRESGNTRVWLEIDYVEQESPAGVPRAGASLP